MYRYICKSCGGESPAGIGYAFNVEGPIPAPAAGCPNRHAGPVTLHGFVFTVARFQSGEVIPREHPAYRRPSGTVVWAPNREYWRDAPPDIAGTFLPAGERAAEHMRSLRREPDTVLRFPGFPPVRGVGPVIIGIPE